MFGIIGRRGFRRVPRAGYLLVLLLWVATSCGCGVIIPRPADEYVDGKLRITYWETWTNIYGKALQDVVDRFNAGQSRIYVEVLTVSQINQKALLAIAGGNPPDLIGLLNYDIPQFAEQGAIACVDPFMDEAGLRRKDFIDIFLEMNEYRGKLYGLPTTPYTIALLWNKDLFEEAGLDPEAPPLSLDELDDMAARLTKYDAAGNLIQLGFSPYEPGWWSWAWPYWFGGSLWDGDARITLDSPENLRAFKWVQSYIERYGSEQMQTFRSGFGNFNSPQNAFLSGKVAMVLQGPWMDTHINKFAPGLRWGAAPFPSAVPGLEKVAVAECNSICIPVGARHPKAAFEFVRYLCSQEASEMLNLRHGKFTPLKEVSREFIENHPNPYIQTFIELARSPNAVHTPRMGLWYEYTDELGTLMDAIRLGTPPEKLMPDVQRRLQEKLDRVYRHMRQREAKGKGGV